MPNQEADTAIFFSDRVSLFMSGKIILVLIMLIKEIIKDLCLLPMDEGSCQRYTLRWYFNSQVQACRPFIYSGCKGNNNRFLHQEECEEACLRKNKGSGWNT
uniref:BPTI/Kunitz inhibitor domain-containing protein n=1 Tax=Cyprinodon variegatus TaxID=28743 RepID=A0A3Q2CHE1_CYPVA